MASRSRTGIRLDTFRDATRGLVEMVRSEPNARVHVIVAIAVVNAGLVLGIDRTDWLVLTLAIAAVLSLEAANTALESLCDAVTQEKDERIRRAKDVAAGAVLIAAIASVLVGALVFAPRVVELVSG